MSEKNESIPIKEFEKFSNYYIPEIDSFINSYFKQKSDKKTYAFMKEMYSDLNDYCGRKGKRIRPLILLVAYNGYSKENKKRKEMIKLAAVVEIMHSFLLIQDDVIDRSLIRRGEKALHVLCREKYSSITHNNNIGNDVALIQADVLFACAVDIICNSKIDLKVKNDFLGIFSSTYEMTAWGQILDILHTKPKKINVKDNIPMQVSSLKTAYYTIYYPLLMGHILAGGTKKKEKGLIEKFALPLGLAFQIRDDILGVFGKEEKTGKPADSDIIEGKLTLLVQCTFDILKGRERDEFINLIVLNKKKKSDINKIRSTIMESGALKQASDQHLQLVNDAVENLKLLEIDDKNKTILLGIVELIKKI